jgi:integrase
MIPSPRRPVSPETQRLYKANWASFEDWCGGRALTTLPADPATVAAFLTEAAPGRWAAAPRRPPPAKPSALIRMATRCPRDVAGLRGRALLLLAAGGLGRAALVGLDVEHIRFTAAGAELSAHPDPAPYLSRWKH